MSKNSLSTNEELRQGEILHSTNGKHRAIFQDDNNFVIYGPDATWHTDTSKTTGSRLIVQEDGNLVMYTDNKRVVWTTDTYSEQQSQRMRLTLTNQGHLELDRDGEQIWSSATSKGKKM
ncbi:B-type lectin plumieribetin-like [Polymixia lowei]